MTEQVYDLDSLQLEDEQLHLNDREPVGPKCEFLTGPAGTGKTFEMKRRIQEDPKWGILTATTGIAAVNLDSITLNSLLKYFNTEDLEDKFVNGRITRLLADLRAEGFRNLVIDEVSMLDAKQLDILYEAIKQSSTYTKVNGDPLGLVVTGDFCQLPPVNAPWAFQAEVWPEFERNTTRLTRQWRQSDPGFLEALKFAREGRGREAVQIFQDLGVAFRPGVDSNFDGTTITAKNVEVDRYNFLSLQKVQGRAFGLEASRWGQQRPEWVWRPNSGGGIPDKMRLKIGALVMILSNDTTDWTYANGDTGHIVDYRPGPLLGRGTVSVELKRTGRVVDITRINRKNMQRDAPQGYKMPESTSDARDAEAAAAVTGGPYYSVADKKWVLGSITYFPLRLAYASTVHKSQGLTLDAVQIDCRGSFFGEPNMGYVALSRCRTPEGLRIVGLPELLAKRINVAPEVEKWL